MREQATAPPIEARARAASGLSSLVCKQPRYNREVNNVLFDCCTRGCVYVLLGGGGVRAPPLCRPLCLFREALFATILGGVKWVRDRERERIEIRRREN